MLLSLSDVIKDKDKDPFIGQQEFVVRYSKDTKQPQSSAWPICQSHAMTRTGREPAIICIAAYWSSPCYGLRHGRQHTYIYDLHCHLLFETVSRRHL